MNGNGTSQRVPDSAFLLALLTDGDWHGLTEIIRRSQAQRGHGLTVHSRVADLRKRGFTVEQRDEWANGRRLSFYRLVSLAQPETTTPNDFVNLDRATAVPVRDGISGSASEREPKAAPLNVTCPPLREAAGSAVAAAAQPSCEQPSRSLQLRLEVPA